MELSPELAGKAAMHLKFLGREGFARNTLLCYHHEPNRRTEALARVGWNQLTDLCRRKLRRHIRGQ